MWINISIYISSTITYIVTSCSSDFIAKKKISSVVLSFYATPLTNGILYFLCTYTLSGRMILSTTSLVHYKFIYLNLFLYSSTMIPYFGISFGMLSTSYSLHTLSSLVFYTTCTPLERSIFSITITRRITFSFSSCCLLSCFPFICTFSIMKNKWKSFSNHYIFIAIIFLMIEKLNPSTNCMILSSLSHSKPNLMPTLQNYSKHSSTHILF